MVKRVSWREAWAVCACGELTGVTVLAHERLSIVGVGMFEFNPIV